MSKQARQRSQNWSFDERQLFRRLIRDYNYILEDKRTDCDTSNKKRVAWANILKRFNAANHRERTLKQLHFKWRNTKMRIKRHVRKELEELREEKKRDDLNSFIEIDFENVYVEKVKEEPEISNSVQSIQDISQVNALKETEEDREVQIKAEPITIQDDGIPETEEFVVPTPVELKARTPVRPKTTMALTRDDYYKRTLFLLSKKAKEKELEYMAEIHEEQLKSIEMERSLKLKCIEEEHQAKMKLINNNRFC